jgi:RHS repeat-associated protein
VKSVLTGQTTSYSYDGQNQLVGATMPSGNASYQYDAMGRRVERTTNTAVGAPIYYVYDNQDIVAMVDGSGSLIGLFTRGPNIDEPLELRQGNGTEYFIHADALGSVVAHSDGNGAVVERIEYEAYGQPVFLDLRSGSPVVEPQSFTGDPFAFTGREWDGEVRLYNYRYRQNYNPITGRFGQSDPIGLQGGIDLYVYADGNPVAASDPSGTIVFASPPGTVLPPKEYFPYGNPFGPAVPLPSIGPLIPIDINAVDQCVDNYLKQHYPPFMLSVIDSVGLIMPAFNFANGKSPNRAKKNEMIGHFAAEVLGEVCEFGPKFTIPSYGVQLFANFAQGRALNTCLNRMYP